MGRREVIFEFIPQAHFVRVVAVDVETGREVMMMGSRTVPTDQLKKTAYQKLMYVLKKEGVVDNEGEVRYC